jgi:hypothetical protein
VHYIRGLMQRRVPFIVVEVGADTDLFMLHHLHRPGRERAAPDRANALRPRCMPRGPWCGFAEAADDRARGLASAFARWPLSACGQRLRS